MKDRDTNVAHSQDDDSGTLSRSLPDLSLLLIAGRLTGDHLRSAVDDPLLKNLVSKGGFRGVMENACEKIRPNVTKEASLLLELWAAERKSVKLFVERCYRQS